MGNFELQVGHLPVLPAHSSRTFSVLPHPGHLTEIDMPAAFTLKMKCSLKNYGIV